jgi:VWFA-related protein
MGLSRARLLEACLAVAVTALALGQPGVILSASPKLAPSEDSRGAQEIDAPSTQEPPDPGTGPELPSPVIIRFIEPAAHGLILGETLISVEASTTSDASILDVRVYADGTLLTILETPPYSFSWNAGAYFLRRVLRAVATDSAGRSGEAILVVRPLYIGQYEEVRLVNVFATARDRKGRAVRDLTKDDFMVLEDGVAQNVSHFTSAHVPLTVALLIDASNSMNLGGKIDLARRAADDFVKRADPEDRLMALHFNDELHGMDRPVADAQRLEEEIEAIKAEGGTALYDAIHRTAGHLLGVEGRRAIVLLSDGRDQALADNEPGSLHLFEEALEKAHRSEVAIYAIGLGHHLEKEMDLRRVRSLREILETLAVQTGGRSYFPTRARQLSGIYREIAEDLKTQYTLAYSSTNRARDGRWRSITVRVGQPGLRVDARAGYYAPGHVTP